MKKFALVLAAVAAIFVAAPATAQDGMHRERGMHQREGGMHREGGMYRHSMNRAHRMMRHERRMHPRMMHRRHHMM
jgi:Ni/Co efflux regulator RcnB